MTTVRTVDEIWLGDSLGRRADADLLVQFLTKRIEERGPGVGAYVINLNTGWGTGKTFFLQRLHEQLTVTGYLASYVDAWHDDDAGEPLVAVMSAIDATLKPHLKGKAALGKVWDTALAAGGQAAVLALKGAAYQGAKRLIGPAVDGIEKLVEDIAIDDVGSEFADRAADEVADLATTFLRRRLEDYRAHRKSTEAFRVRVGKVLDGLRTTEGRKLPYFILIDELDRCRPTYAVEMLEQVKHLFDIDNVCFVLATDGSQLAHSVRAVYGSTFDGDTYLRRFFNRSYRFGAPSRRDYVSHLVNSTPIDVDIFSMVPGYDFAGSIGSCTSAYKLSLRDIDQVFDQVRSVASFWNRRARIELTYLLPLIITHHIGDISNWNELRSGNTRSIPSEWRGDVDKIDNRRGTIERVRLPVSRILDQLSSALISIDDVMANQPSETGGWFRERLRDEMTAEYKGNLRRSGSKRPTLLAQYPEMVISLARLADPAE